MVGATGKGKTTDEINKKKCLPLERLKLSTCKMQRQVRGSLQRQEQVSYHSVECTVMQ